MLLGCISDDFYGLFQTIPKQFSASIKTGFQKMFWRFQSIFKLTFKYLSEKFQITLNVSKRFLHSNDLLKLFRLLFRHLVNDFQKFSIKIYFKVSTDNRQMSFLWLQMIFRCRCLLDRIWKVIVKSSKNSP